MSDETNHPERSAPFFIIGSPRSGTTMLRNILREHPGLACPEETFFYRWSEPFGTERYERFLKNDPTMWKHRELDGFSEDAFWNLYEECHSRRDLQEAYMTAFLKRHQRSSARWFDKTPQNTYGLLLLLADYPASGFLHVHRNPVNVVASIRLGRTVGPESIRGAVNMWIEAVQAAEEAKRLCPERVRRVSYEALTENPQDRLNQILEFLDVPAMTMPAHLPVYPAIQRFPDVLSEAEFDYVLSRCRPWMDALAYPLESSQYSRINKAGTSVSVKKRLARMRRKTEQTVNAFLGTGQGAVLQGGFGESIDTGLLPTTSLYLRDALDDEGLEIDWHASRVGTHTYIIGQTAIIVRYADSSEWTAIQQWLSAGSRRLVYVTDDDLEAMVSDPQLPAKYRQKLRPFVRNVLPELMDAADLVVVSSPALRTLHAEQGKDCVLLDPYWRIPPRVPLRSGSGAALRLAWLATRSHLNDLENVWPQLSRFLDQTPSARLTVFMGPNAPQWLDSHPGVSNRAVLPWNMYRAALQSEAFHVTLYPVMPTTVNKARSFSKFFELASTGAAPVFSETVTFSKRLTPDVNCCLVSDQAWTTCLQALNEDPVRRESIAATAHADALALSRASRARQVSFWRSTLELP